ncbi:MAG: TonB-dependent receptor [Gammaproteobacteria bacterium]|nr:TonB-dependent receptor [Gammaproteobacteria bacterium]
MNTAKTYARVVTLAGLAAGLAAAALAQTPAGEQLQEIEVTGSRIITNGNDSPTPLTVVDAEQFLKLQPTAITEAVNLLPALQGSQNVTSRPGGGQRNGAAAWFNLRNMGNLRTLNLYDGQRLIPTINQNEADTDATLVPQLLLKRVDVVTGGVSAVYGSDAISGVVNFITDRDFNGIKVQANSGVSTYGDDRTRDFGIAGGMAFSNGRGHIEGSYQYHDDAGLQNRAAGADRSFYAANAVGVGAGTAANPYFNMPDARLSNATFGGLIQGSSVAAHTTVLRGLQFLTSGQLAAFNHGQIPLAGGTLAPFGTPGTLASANVESGGDGAWYSGSSLKHGIDFHQAFGRIDYDLTDDLHAFAQIAYTKIHSYNQFRQPLFNNYTFSYSNPFLLATQEPYRSMFLGSPTATLRVSELLQNNPRSTQDTKAHLVFAGLEGKLGARFDWEINITNSRSIIQANDLFNFDRGRLAAALDAVDVGLVTTGTANGQIACRATVDYTGHAANPNYAGCVPLNIFGGQPGQASLDYLYETTFNRNRTQQDTADVAITGAPFDNWAGPVKTALSVEYRRLRWDAVTNTDPSARADCAGIGAGLNCTPSTALWFNNTMGPVPQVSQTVKEAALEVGFPLLADLPAARNLDFTGAVRHTNYDTSGSVTTWKAGLSWNINDQIRLRATRSRDIRAPNLFDLFTSVQVNCSFSGTDPLTGGTFTNLCNTQGSNPDLKPEIGNTSTVGIVLTPSMLPGFSLAVDYFKIDVGSVILLQQGWSNATLNYCNQVRGNAPVCALISRANWTDTNWATNPITAFASQNVNVAELNTHGIDVEAGYQTRLFSRAFNARLLASHQPELIYNQGPSGTLSFAGAYYTGSNRFAALPKWKVTGILSYDVTERFNVTVLERWRSSLNASYDPRAVLLRSKLPSVAYTTLNLSYRDRDTRIGDAEAYLSIQNLFNTWPEVYYPGTNTTAPGQQPYLPEGDDTIGRYFTLGVRVRL